MNCKPLLVSLCLPSLLSAQGLSPGEYAVIDYGGNAVYRLTEAGSATILHQGPPLTSPTGVAVAGNLDLWVSDFSSGSIYRLPRNGTLQPFASGVTTPIRIALDRDGSILVAALSAGAIQRVSVNGQVSTVAQGAPLVRPFDVAVDYDGSYIVVEEGSSSGPPAVYRINAGGAVTPVWVGSPLRLPHGVALLADGDYAVIDGLVDAVFRVPRSGSMPTVMTQTPAIINPDALCADFEGRVVVAEELASGRRVDIVDRFGAVTTLLNPAPWSNVEAIVKAPQLAGPARGGPGQSSTLTLEFPGQGQRTYVLWASASVIPGFALAPPDVRAIPGNPDGLLFASIGANNALFAGFVGVLSPTGTATAQVNVPNIQLPPLTLFLQGLTVDFTQPSGIRSLANLHALQL